MHLVLVFHFKQHPKKNIKLDLHKILHDSKINLSWLPIEEITTLQHCKILLDDIRFNGKDAYTFSIVFMSIETFFHDLAKIYLSIDAHTSATLDSELIIEVCQKYGDTLIGYSKGGDTGGLMSSELYSHRVLMSWLKFCLLFKIGCDTITLLSSFSVPLKYHDLEHLVLKDKWAWEILDLICKFLQRCTKQGCDVIFSGRKDETDGMWALADQYVNQYSEFSCLWNKEQADASLRIDNRWSDIQRKKELCEQIRKEIARLKCEISDNTSQRNLENEHITEDYYSSHHRSILNRTVINPVWERLTRILKSLQHSIDYQKSELTTAQKAPNYLKEPLPKGAVYGKRALFYIHMPKLLRNLWKASFEAQEVIFSDGAPMPDNEDECDFHSFYDGPSYPYRQKKTSIRTPLTLWINTPPKNFGSDNVEYIHNREDGVWYQSSFSPSIKWTNGKNPFDARRSTAVERFSETITDASLQWTVIQRGFETPPERGNVPLSKLDEKPMAMTRDQFLALGNLRALPLLQLFHLIDSIKAKSLPFHENFIKTTHTVVRQALYHIGEIQKSPGGVLVKKWKSGLEPFDSRFMDKCRRVLASAIETLKDASKNKHELFIYMEIISFLSQFDTNWVELADQCSDIAFGWASRMEGEIQKARDDSRDENVSAIQEKQHLFLLYALVCYEMVTVINDKRVKRISELMLRVHSSRPIHIRGDSVNHLTHRAYFLMARILPMFPKNKAIRDALLTDVVEKVLPGYIDSQMNWIPLEHSYCWYTENRSGDYLSINIMNGNFLVNGSPPSTLPEEVRKHPLFLRVFGKNDFEVTVDKYGVRKSLQPVLERYYSFLMDGQELLIYEEFQNEKFRLLDVDACTTWSKGLAVGMIKLYSHWQSENRKIIYFRPIHYRQRSTYYIFKTDGLFKVPREDSSKSVQTITDNSIFYDRNLLLDPKMIRTVEVFSKFDQIEYIHPYITHEKVFKVWLPRYRISFEFQKGAKFYECPEFVGYKLSSAQQFSGLLYGFYEYLILERDFAGPKVVLPQGAMKKVNGAVSIERDPEAIDEVSPNAYAVNIFAMHSKFKCLQAVDVLSGLQLASIQAATSSSLPEQGLQLTGYEMAIQQIRKCWVNRPLFDAEFQMLEALLALKDLPPALVILGHQLYKCTLKLSFLFPPPPYERSILNIDEFSRAVNEYNLPLQYHLSVRNYRMTLMADEMNSCPRMIKSPIDVYAMNSLARLEMLCNKAQRSGAYKKKIEDIISFENQLLALTTTSKKDHSIEFPLRTLPSLQHRKIGEHMVNGLKDSYKLHLGLGHPKLCFFKEWILLECTNLEDSARRQKQELYKILIERIVDDVGVSSGNADGFRIYKAGNGIPVLTMADLVQASWQPQNLKHFNPMLGDNDIKELFLIIVDWMQFSVLEDRIARIRQNLESNMIDLAVQELQVHRKYDPYKYPQWLAFEYDQSLQIRPEQMLIIDQILKNNGSVAQLNMGLGKTRVIVPCLLLEWSTRSTKREGQFIPRAYLLSRLLDEGFDYFHRTLTGGIFAKKLFRMPFNRDVQLSLDQATLFVASLKYCQTVGGAVILAPEHCLSLFLKGFELEQNVDTTSISEKIREIENLPFVDIFDEVDEMMCPNQELIYAEGLPVALESGARRWGAIQSLFYHVRHHPKLITLFQGKELADFDTDKFLPDEFNKFRLLPGKRLDQNLKSLILEIGESLFNKMTFAPESTLSWLYEGGSAKLRRKIIKFITDPSESSEIVKESDFVKPEHFQDLLILRGLLAHEVFIHCLKQRHDVDYGVVPNHKTLMAIPFRAANLPKLRSEFAQPDCAITFTILSYYYIGLTREQTIINLFMLMRTGPSFQNRVYKEFFQLCSDSNRDNMENLLTIDSINKLDLSNQVQVDMLHRVYRKNMLFINFWLSHVLFPTATMIFPGKLMASSWNLTDSRKSKHRCGFSGTDDACILLPYPLTHQEPNVASLKATNGKMLSHLLNKASFCPVPKLHCGETIVVALLKLAVEKKVDAFIDCGAILADRPIEKVALEFLDGLVHSKSRFKGVVYYSSEKCSWRAIDGKRRETSLSTSPIQECDAFVIYDQSRCRGADMKLRPDAKAILSIGPRQCKDSLMQAAGRLRQLDFGQEIIAIATADVELMIKDCVGIKANNNVAMEHVLCYALFNSVDAIGNALRHWSGQGLRFLNFFHDQSHARGKEKCDLLTLYAMSDNISTVSEVAKQNLDQIKACYDISCEISQAVLEVVKDRTQQLGVDVKANSVVNVDECERELEHEREMENEKEKEFPKMRPFAEVDWDYKKIFSVDSPRSLFDAKVMSISDFTKSFLSKQASNACSINWDIGKVYLTLNFACPLVEKSPYDDFLRPIRLILHFPRLKEILLLSEGEADKIWRCYLEKNDVEQSDGPILCGTHFLLSDNSPDFLLSNAMESSFIGNLISTPGNVPAASHSALTLFNGQTKFSQQDQEALETNLLQSRQATDGAQFFCNHRGLCIMFQGSDLEKTCDRIYQRLHASVYSSQSAEK